MRAWSKLIAVAAAAGALVSPAFAKNSSFDQQVRKMERYNARAQFSPARRRLDGSAPALESRLPSSKSADSKSQPATKSTVGNRRDEGAWEHPFTRHVPHLQRHCERLF
jgi:hypothetical protein